ncbi:hypothetical protein H9P43_005864 [Blastocladiella emersonii ATCC 22665]|nr:hypothetical protein H9P43_005864 [Blastocladiella emersonii ATCC 22665]
MTADAVDPRPPPYLMELCPNTQTVHFCVSITTANADSPLETTTAVAVPTSDHGLGAGVAVPVAGLLLTPLEIVVSGASYKFPSPVEPRSLSAHMVGRDLVVRCKLRHVAGTRPSTQLRHQHFDATPLLLADTVAKSSAIRCAGCRAALLTSPPASVRALPSSTWHDLVECWACHEQHVVMPTSGHVAVARDACWVGPSVLVVHGDALLAGSVKWTAAPHVRDPNALTLDRTGVTTVAQCAVCSAVVGYLPRATPADGVHLYKTRVLAARSTSPDAEEWTWNLAKVHQASLMAELLDHVTSHAAHRVTLVSATPSSPDHPAGTPFAVVWTVNWNCRVRTRRLASSRALKVLYRTLTPDETTAGAQATVAVADPAGLLAVLAGTTAQLPTSQQSVEIKGEAWRTTYLMS